MISPNNFGFFIVLAFLRIKGLPFNCEASQFQDYPLDSCNRNEYEIYESYSEGQVDDQDECSIESTRGNCKHFKICQHKKGLSDCKTTNYYGIGGYVSRGEEGSKCPKALILQETTDPNEEMKIFRTYSALENQEGILELV